MKRKMENSVINHDVRKNVTHVIFDMDGLLLDTETIYTAIANEVAAKYTPEALEPKTVSWELKAKQMGLQRMDLAVTMVKELNLTCTPEEYLEASRVKHLDLFPEVDLMPGVERLLRHFLKHNVPMAVATSCSKEYFELKTTKKHSNIFIGGNYFHHIVTGSSDPDVKKGKPFPDINLVCASRFHPPADPANCLVFEDSPNGAKAAIAAGMQCVMVPDPQMWSTPGHMTDATMVIRSLNDFRPDLFGIPSF